jgi:hypothetical protein
LGGSPIGNSRVKVRRRWQEKWKGKQQVTTICDSLHLTFRAHAHHRHHTSPLIIFQYPNFCCF